MHTKRRTSSQLNRAVLQGFARKFKIECNAHAALDSTVDALLNDVARLMKALQTVNATRVHLRLAATNCKRLGVPLALRLSGNHLQDFSCTALWSPSS
jgi:hypothetical protein